MAEYDHYQRLIIDRPAPGVLRLAMNNPGRLNAADETMHTELCRIWGDIDHDDSVRCAIITGANGTYSAGGDLDMVDRTINEFETRARLWRETKDLVYNMTNCRKPVVSAMEGVAVGVGLVCGMLADISIGARDLRIIDGHTRLGVVAGDHSALIWPLLCGMAKAKYYLLLCDPVSGEEAERIGLISLAVDKADLEAKSIEIAKRLAGGAATAISWTKYALNNWLRVAGPTFDASAALEFLAFTGPEAREGLQSLREKRKPRFVTGD